MDVPSAPFVSDPRFLAAYERAMWAGGRDHRMRWRAHTLLWAAETAARSEGTFVECGTGRGFMASAVCHYLNWTTRPFYLFDTFMPTRPDDTGDQAANGPVEFTYALGPEEVAANFAAWPGVRLVVGRIPATLSDEPERVAFLHMDLNHAPTEAEAIRHFWPRLVPGGLVVWDDYDWIPNKQAADDAGREFGFTVLTLPTGQGLAVKR